MWNNVTKNQDMFWDNVLAGDLDLADRFATCYADTCVAIRKLLGKGNAAVYHVATEDQKVELDGTTISSLEGERIQLKGTRFVDPPAYFKPKPICVTSNSFNVTSKMIQSSLGSDWEL
jgi:hypothetical protein